MSKSYDIPGLGRVVSYADTKPIEKAAPEAPKPVEMPKDYVGTDPFGGQITSAVELKAKASKGGFQENKVTSGDLEEKDAEDVLEPNSIDEEELSDKDADEIIEEAERVAGELKESDADDVIEDDDKIENDNDDVKEMDVEKSYLSLGDMVFVPSANLRGSVQRLASYVKKSGTESEDSISVTIKGNGRLETYDVSEVMPAKTS